MVKGGMDLLFGTGGVLLVGKMEEAELWKSYFVSVLFIKENDLHPEKGRMIIGKGEWKLHRVKFT